MVANTDTVQQSDVLMGHLTHHTDRFKESLTERAQCQRSESKGEVTRSDMGGGGRSPFLQSNDLLASWVECY